ncbi:MAG TPA: membrane protein insertion efficiency factor YidD [Planctomycetes bacterium]|nr:membrane protein insertion efficiency factor YidD [Planctomycetota bacterium]
MKVLRRIVVLPILAYRRWITPFTPPSCRFHPTCSAYGVEAILRHGVLKGLLLLAWRILRCQPFCVGGLDPVPEPGAWRSHPDPPEDGRGDGAETGSGRDSADCE